MNHRCFMAMTLMIIGVTGCSVKENAVEQTVNYRLVFEADPFINGDADTDTKTYVEPNSDYSSYAFKWAERDTVGIYPDAGSQVYFTMAGGAGAGTAEFDGGAWTCKEGHEYRSYFPFVGDIYLDATNIPVSFTGQKQVGNANSDHFQQYDYMYTPMVTKGSDNLTFSYHHLITAILPWVELPAGHYTGITLSLDEPLFVTEGHYDLTAASPAIVGTAFSSTLNVELDVTFTTPDILKVFIPLAPLDMSGKTLTITVTDEDNHTYEFTKNPSKVYEAGKIYRLRSDTSFLDISFVDPAVKEICVANWDTNSDGELSYAEAAAVTSIGRVFDSSDIVSFDELQFFTGLTEVGLRAFNCCVELTSIIIPNNVISIGDYAFECCRDLTSVTLPEGLISIGVAFGNCEGLTSIAIPGNVTSVASNAFGGCSGLTAFVSPLASQDQRCLLLNGEIVGFCPSGLSSYTIPSGVTSIGKAFYGCSGLTTVVIPNSVTEIGEDAFSFTGLTSIVLPDSIVIIRQGAFSGCINLSDVTLSNCLTVIEQSAFAGCGLGSITIPSCTTSIGTNAFFGCDALTAVFIESPAPPTLGDYVFHGFSGPLDCNIYVPVGCADIYQSASGWSGYASKIMAIVQFADSNVKALCVTNWDIDGDGELSESETTAVTSLGTVFRFKQNIVSFDELQYFTSLNEIGEACFNGCSGLTSIVIPDSVTSIGECAFGSCIALTSITIPNGVTSVGRLAFTNCSGLTSVTIPNGSTSFGRSPFDGCRSMTRFISPLASQDQRCLIANGELIHFCPAGVSTYSIPEGVTSIGEGSFGMCSGLTGITIPSTVNSIKRNAFNGCSGLTYIVVNAITPPSLSSNVFDGSSCPIYVPAASVGQYQTGSDSDWWGYADRITAIP